MGALSLGMDYDHIKSNNYYNGVLDTSASSETKDFSARVGVEANYFVKRDFSLGLGVSYQYSESIEEYKGQSSSDRSKGFRHSYSARILGRHYVRFSRDLAYFTYGSISYSHSESSRSQPRFANAGSDFISQSIRIGLNPGLSYLITPKMAAEIRLGSLSYRYQRVIRRNENPIGGTQKRDDSYSGVDLSFGLSSLSVGLVFFLN